jgi:hypothetical protein
MIISKGLKERVKRMSSGDFAALIRTGVEEYSKPNGDQEISATILKQGAWAASKIGDKFFQHALSERAGITYETRIEQIMIGREIILHPRSKRKIVESIPECIDNESRLAKLNMLAARAFRRCDYSTTAKKFSLHSQAHRKTVSDLRQNVQ